MATQYPFFKVYFLFTKNSISTQIHQLYIIQLIIIIIYPSIKNIYHFIFLAKFHIYQANIHIIKHIYQFIMNIYQVIKNIYYFIKHFFQAIKHIYQVIKQIYQAIMDIYLALELIYNLNGLWNYKFLVIIIIQNQFSLALK